MKPKFFEGQLLTDKKRCEGDTLRRFVVAQVTGYSYHIVSIPRGGVGTYSYWQAEDVFTPFAQEKFQEDLEKLLDE